MLVTLQHASDDRVINPEAEVTVRVTWKPGLPKTCASPWPMIATSAVKKARRLCILKAQHSRCGQGMCLAALYTDTNRRQNKLPKARWQTGVRQV